MTTHRIYEGDVLAGLWMVQDGVIEYRFEKVQEG